MLDLGDVSAVSDLCSISVELFRGLNNLHTEQLALTEACYVITRIVQRFDKIENMDPVDHVVNYAAIGNRSGTGIVVKMHRAGAMHDV